MKKLLWLNLAILSFSACQKDAAPAAFLKIENPSLTTNVIAEGANTCNIKDGMLIVNSQVLGQSSFPFSLPVTALGTQAVRVRPCILMNGSQDSRVPYPFYDDYRTTLTFTEGGVQTINPTFEYKSNVQFPFIEDFEQAGTVFGVDLDGDADSYLAPTTEGGILSGLKSGVIKLDTAHPVYASETSNRYQLTRNEPVYLEIDYKASCPFVVGIDGYDNGAANRRTIVYVFPSDTWQKLYINLYSDVLSLNADEYAITLGASLTQDSITNSVYLDNIKLVHTP